MKTTEFIFRLRPSKGVDLDGIRSSLEALRATPGVIDMIIRHDCGEVRIVVEIGGSINGEKLHRTLVRKVQKIEGLVLGGVSYDLDAVHGE